MVASRLLPRRPEAWMRVGAVALAVVLLIVSVAVGASVYRGELILLFAGVVGHTLSIPLALVRPLIAAPLSLVGATVVMIAASFGSAPWPWAVTTMITQALILALLGYRAHWLLGGGTLVLGVAGSWVVALLFGGVHDQQAVAIDLVVFASVGGTALAAGIVAQKWQAIRRQLASERRLTSEERARRQLAEEKTRIARELHDVVAHSMSIITVQATSAPIRHPEAGPALRREFEEIAESSRRALAEMRSLLGVLRDPAAPVLRTPQPRLSGIAELVDQSRSSGLSVQISGAELLTDEDVDEAVGLTAFRIVQEALSNVIRHARGAEVDVRVRRDLELDLVISNTAPPMAPGESPDPERRQGSGSGHLGMRERAASVGGSLAFGPTSGGGYEVQVTLPLRQASATSQGPA